MCRHNSSTQHQKHLLILQESPDHLNVQARLQHSAPKASFNIARVTKPFFPKFNAKKMHTPCSFSSDVLSEAQNMTSRWYTYLLDQSWRSNVNRFWVPLLIPTWYTIFYINYITLSSSTCFERHSLIFRSVSLTVHVCSLWCSHSLQVAILCTC